MPETIPVACISTQGTQTRTALNELIIGEYAEAYKQGVELPPIDVYFDNDVYWLSDGFHRVRAAQKLGRDAITANVHQGGQRDAILHAVGANETHGLRRTNADRRKVVQLMLNDPEWSMWSDRAIAKQCHVSDMLVGRVRREIVPKEQERVTEEKTRKVQRGEKVYTMRTERIGAPKKKPPAKPTAVSPKQPVSDGQPTSAMSVVDSEPLVLSATKLQIESKSPTTATLKEPPADTAPATIPDVTTATLEREPSPETAPATLSQLEPDTPSVAVDQEPITAPDQPPPAEPGPDDAIPSPVTVMSAAAAAVYSLEDAWDWATQADRRAFVTAHYDEIRPIFVKLDRQKTGKK